MSSYKSMLIQKFFDNGIIKRQGEKYPDGFMLKSGIRSDIYINLRDIIKFPVLFRFTIDCLQQLVDDTYYHKNSDKSLITEQQPCIVGIPTMGAVIAPILAYKSRLLLAVVRQHKKEHGIGSNIEGTLTKNILIIDDVITSGSSVEEFINQFVVPKFGQNFTREMYVVVDRQEHPLAGVTSLMTLNDIREHKIIMEN